MTAKNKRRGTDFEREVVEAALEHRLDAVRAWGSDGRALGLAPEVDVLVAEHFKIQCKRRKRLPAYLLPAPGIHGTAIRQDGNRETYIVVRLDDLLSLIRAVDLTMVMAIARTEHVIRRLRRAKGADK